MSAAPDGPGLAFTLLVRPASPAAPWEATLLGPGPEERRTFAHPVDLALYLEALGRPAGWPERRGLK